MREILFKAKRKDSGEWAYGDLVHNRYIEDDRIFIQRYQKYITSDFYDDDIVEIIPETISQYTGLIDKNGVKIFENDIVRLDDEHRKLISSANAKTEEDLVRKDCLVGFKYGSFMFCRNRYVIDDFDSYLWLSNEHCEVIGNIFDEEVK